MLSSYISLAYQEQLFGVDLEDQKNDDAMVQSNSDRLREDFAGNAAVQQKQEQHRSKEEQLALQEFLKPPPLPWSEQQCEHTRKDPFVKLPKTGTTRVLIDAPMLPVGNPGPEPLGDMRPWMVKERKAEDMRARHCFAACETVYNANAMEWPWRARVPLSGEKTEHSRTHSAVPACAFKRTNGGRVLSPSVRATANEREDDSSDDDDDEASHIERAVPTRPSNAGRDVEGEREAALQFESRFEGGNLLLAQRTGEWSYDLTLRTDYFTEGHAQWFYFSVSRPADATGPPGQVFWFSIVNLTKPDSLYNHGLRPLVNSVQCGHGWVRGGEQIGYYENGARVGRKSGHTLSFRLAIAAGDTVHLAHCYPYSYSDLQRDLDAIEQDPDKTRLVRRRALCDTVAGNACEVLMVTDPIPSLAVQAERPVVVVSARVHPGESNASWMMKGVLDALLGETPEARELRARFDFRLLPMLNPDGVVNGNYRCNLAGHDLNRRYKQPIARRHPTIAHLKELVRALVANRRRILLYVDLHGHSVKRNVFAYGCDSRLRAEATTRQAQAAHAHPRLAQLFTFLLHRHSPLFSFSDCRFRVQRSKEATSRVVMWRELGIDLSFTLEASFCGADAHASSDREGMHFNTTDLREMGRALCSAILELGGLEDDSDKMSTLVEEMDALFPPATDEEEAYTSSDDQAIASEEEETHEEVSKPEIQSRSRSRSRRKAGGRKGSGRSRDRATDPPSSSRHRDSVNFLSDTKSRSLFLEAKRVSPLPLPVRASRPPALPRRPASASVDAAPTPAPLAPSPLSFNRPRTTGRPGVATVTDAVQGGSNLKVACSGKRVGRSMAWHTSPRRSSSEAGGRTERVSAEASSDGVTSAEDGEEEVAESAKVTSSRRNR